ncbi:aminotransferase class V-fold PLP-dependent enzyme [soil metagenome]
MRPRFTSAGALVFRPHLSIDFMLDLRDRFALPSHSGIELRAFTHGLMPRTVPTMMEAFTRDWQNLGVDAWNSVPNHWMPESEERVGWWSLPDYLGDAFIAPLLTAPRGTCIMQPNVHWTVQCLLSAPEPYRDGRTEIVLTEAEFPSVRHSVRQWAQLRGLRIREIALTEDGSVDIDAILESVGPETAWVFVSHVAFATGAKIPDGELARLSEASRAMGAHFAVDGYHATGSIDVDVSRLDADVYFGGLLKEGCGSSGNAYLYVRPGLDLTPMISGWFGDADPFAFAAASEAHPQTRRRFLAGTTAVASLYHAVEGVRILLDAGLGNVRADSLAKTARCIEAAERMGLPLISHREDDLRGAMVVFEAPEAERLSQYLKTQGVYTDSRRNRYLRLAPFVWNSTDEVDKAMDSIADNLRSERYRDFEMTRETGPVT